MNYSSYPQTNNTLTSVTKHYTQTTVYLQTSTMSAMITIACGRPSSSRRRTTQQRSTSLSAYMPKGLRSTQSGVTQRRTTVAKKVQPKSFRSNYRVPTTETMKPSGRWTTKLQVKDATTVAHTTRYQPKVRVQVQVDEASAKKKDWEARHAYWMKKEGERRAAKSAAKKAAKQAWKDGAAERLAAKLRKAQEEKARQEELARQQEAEDSDSSDGDFFSSSEDEEEEKEDFPALPTVAKVSKKVSFKDDSENLMKPPCDTKVFNTEDPPSSISDEEEEEVILLTRSANAWKPKRLREEPKVVTSKKEQQKKWHDELLAIWRKEYEASTNSWADTADLCDDLATINALRLELGLPQLDDDGEEIVEEEITTDQFGRPSADNSAW